MTILLNTVVRGVEIGALYALVAAALYISVAPTGVFNFAHGQFVMIGTVVGVIAWQSVGIPVLAALVVALVIAAVFGAVLERVAVRPIVGHGSPQWIVSTLGASIMISTLFDYILVSTGSRQDTRPFPNILPFKHTWHIHGVVVNPIEALSVVVLIAVVVALLIVNRYSRIGRGFAAVADDRGAAAFRGIPVGAMTAGAFAVSAIIAALAGFVSGPLTQADANGGLTLTLFAFVAVIVGGLGSLGGAVIGGLVVGLMEQFIAQYLSADFQDPMLLLLVMFTLTARPQGLLQRAHRTV